MQLLKLATESDVGCFCVKTGCPESNSHRQEFFMDTDLVEEAGAKGDIFFKEVVVPELLTGEDEG